MITFMKAFAAVCLFVAPFVQTLAKCPRIAVSCDISCPSAATCDYHPATVDRCAVVTCIRESDGEDFRDLDSSKFQAVSFVSESTSEQPAPRRHEIHLKKRSSCPDLASRCHCAEGQKCVQIRGNTEFSCGQVKCE